MSLFGWLCFVVMVVFGVVGCFVVVVGCVVCGFDLLEQFVEIVWWFVLLCFFVCVVDQCVVFLDVGVGVLVQEFGQCVVVCEQLFVCVFDLVQVGCCGFVYVVLCVECGMQCGCFVVGQ